MKTTFLYAFMTLLAMAMPMKAQAAEAYAVLNNGSLMFFYDDDKDVRTGIVYEIAPKYGIDYNDLTTAVPEWYYERSSISKIIFDNSFSGYAPESTSCWFYGLTSLESITGLSNLNTSRVTDMSNMFDKCSRMKTLDLSSLNTGNVTDMSYMFHSCSTLSQLIISGFNTAKVANMEEMFSDCSNVTSLDLSSLNTANVTNMQGMFKECRVLTALNLSNFDTSNVSNMRAMFKRCKNLKSLDLSSFNIGKVADMVEMFYDCSSLESLDLSGFNTVNATTLDSVFMQCNSLSKLNLDGWNTTNVRSMRCTFFDCGQLESLDLSSFDTSKVTDMFELFWGCRSLTNIYVGDCWNTYKLDIAAEYIGIFAGCTSLVGGSGTAYEEVWGAVDDSSFAHVDGGVSNPGYLTFKAGNVPQAKTSFDNGDIFADAGTNNVEVLFRVTNASTKTCEVYGNESCPAVPFGTTSDIVIPAQSKGYTVTGVSNYAFYQCNLASLTIPSTVKEIGYYSLYGDIGRLKVESGNTTYDSRNDCNAIIETASNKLIYGANHTEIPSSVSAISSFAFYKRKGITSVTIPAAVTAIGTYAFGGCDNLYDVVSLIENPFVIDNHVFKNYEDAILYVPEGTSEKYKETSSWNRFQKIATGTPDVEEDPASNPVAYAALSHDNKMLTFYYDKKKKGRKGTGIGPFVDPDLRGWNDAAHDLKVIVFDQSFADYNNVTSTAYWFTGCDANYILNMENLHTDNVTDMKKMFAFCNNVKSLNVKHFNTSKVTDMSYMFICGAQNLDLSNFDTRNVTDMSHMFSYKSKKFDLRNFDTRNVTDMSGMFEGCIIDSLDISSFNTSNVTNMRDMFGSFKTKSLDLSNFNTSNVTDMGWMFREFSAEKLDISSLNTSNVVNMDYMFCDATVEELDLRNFNTSKVTDMSGMFAGCKSLVNLNINNFNTANVTNMEQMFYSCSSLETLDLSSFNTANVTNMFMMFQVCSSLVTIYASDLWSTENIYNYTDMFGGCDNLVGGMGTKYSNYRWMFNYDCSLARIDGGTDNPGYLTFKESGSTSISNPAAGCHQRTDYYNLNGIKMRQKPTKGIYLINGKKRLAK